jgi:hypothetical protein
MKYLFLMLFVLSPTWLHRDRHCIFGKDGRALFGLAESVKRQGRAADSETIHQQFEKEWSTSDVKLTVAGLAGIRE